MVSRPRGFVKSVFKSLPQGIVRNCTKKNEHNTSVLLNSPDRMLCSTVPDHIALFLFTGREML